MWPPTSLADLSAIGLLRAFDLGIVLEPYWRFELDEHFWRFALSQSPTKEGDKLADRQSLLSHPEVLRYRQNSHGFLQHPDEGPAFSPWRVELARYAVQVGQVGIIKALEQFVASTDGQTETVWTASERWGDPRVPFGTWVYRISPFQGTEPPWVNQLNPIPTRPGMPYTDLEPEGNLWFPVHCGSSQNIHLLVPGGYVFRVFWECDELEVRPTVACKLRGSVQGQFSPFAEVETRAHW
jgi:hypothetical protein